MIMFQKPGFQDYQGGQRCGTEPGSRCTILAGWIEKPPSPYDERDEGQEPQQCTWEVRMDIRPQERLCASLWKATGFHQEKKDIAEHLAALCRCCRPLLYRCPTAIVRYNARRPRDRNGCFRFPLLPFPSLKWGNKPMSRRKYQHTHTM
jgi:hypothetical protein